MTLNEATRLVYKYFHTEDLSIPQIRELILATLLGSGVDPEDAHILAFAYPHSTYT